MPDSPLEVVSSAMQQAGRPVMNSASSRRLALQGLFIEENRMAPAQVGSLDIPCSMAGMVVSPEPVNWHWKEAGRHHTTQLAPGSILTLPPGPSPEQWWHEPVSILSVSFSAHDLIGAVGHKAATRLRDLRSSPSGASPVVAHLFWALHHSLQNGFPEGRLVVECVGAALAAAVAEQFSAAEDRALAIPKPSLDPRTLRRVVDYIHDHLEADLSLGALARCAHMSEFHFSRCFRQATGQGVHQFVLAQRVARARALLSGTGAPLPEVGARAGLPNQSHFTTVFRQHTGVTPRQYRLETACTPTETKRVISEPA